MEHNSSATKRKVDKNIRCVIIGNDKVGKKHFVWTLDFGHCPNEYVPGLQDSYVIKTELDDLIVGIELLPTAGSDEYARLRPLCYPGAEIFLLFFSVADRASFDAIKPKWVQELHTCDSVPPNVPYLLVGSQTDLRDDNPDPEALKNGHLVSHGEGEELARQIGALKYLECSARKERGLKEIMQEAARIVLQRRENNPSEKKKDKDRCIIQ